MSERIHEILLITRNPDGSPHIAPMGLRQRDALWLLAPFRPSRTLDNLQHNGIASINTTDDVRVYAGCLSGHYSWPLEDCKLIPCSRLQNALSHREIQVARIDDNEQRPEILCKELGEFTHRSFQGYNRAQSAVLELAILVSRLHMLPEEKIEAEVAYLQIAIDKTAGDRELEAWGWLKERINEYRARECA